MTKATYIQPGNSLDYDNTTNKIIEAGSVLDLVTRIGVAGNTILPGEVGSIHMFGVFEITKTKNEPIKQGTALYFDGTGMVTDEKEGDKTFTPSGYAAHDAAATEETIKVKLLG